MIELSNVEFRLQPHEMWVEGKDHIEPTSEEITEFLTEHNLVTAGEIEIGYDEMMGLYNWSVDVQVTTLGNATQGLYV